MTFNFYIQDCVTDDYTSKNRELIVKEVFKDSPLLQHFKDIKFNTCCCQIFNKVVTDNILNDIELQEFNLLWKEVKNRFDKWDDNRD